MYEYGTLPFDQANLKRGTGKRKKGKDEPNWGTLYTYGNVTLKPHIQLLNNSKM
jgi:hypothetical protein